MSVSHEWHIIRLWWRSDSGMPIKVEVLRELGAAVRHGVRGGTQAVFCCDCMLLSALHTGLVEYSKVLCFETERKYRRNA